ncbi:MAG: hypothetical protein WCD79_11140 [Chthoniobacteraceae bacterium]
MKSFKNTLIQKLTVTTLIAISTTAILTPHTASAHGFEGDRFFPPTIQTDDPFATDELSFPTISLFNNPATGDGTPRTRELDFGVEFDKEIFPKFALGISTTYVILKPKGSVASDGFQNLTLSAKYELLEIPGHEFIFSIGGEWEIGNTGSQTLGVNTFSTFTPKIYFGKGFGDLPDGAKFLKPFAVTGTLGLDLPVKDADSNALDWGVAVEYSIPYLQQHVKDIGIPAPFSNMIPLVEFAVTNPLNRAGGQATGTVNPGVLWESKDFQVGLEAVIPVNKATGPNVGLVFNVQIFIDDLMPKIFGHPLFGGNQNSAPAPDSAK